MSFISGMEKRRSIYGLNREIPAAQIEALVRQSAELVPDAFNMRSARVALVMDEKQDALWDAIYDAFGGKVAREKIDSFKAAKGTILYFYDAEVVKAMQEQFPRYAENFPIWANQANGMLQFTLWSALADLGIGANLQHYNPVIDRAVKTLLGLPDSWTLVAQMPFGGIVTRPDPKEKEDISLRVKVFH